MNLYRDKYTVGSAPFDQFPVTFVNLRAIGSKQTAAQEFQSPSAAKTEADDGGTRKVYFDGEWREATTYHRDRLNPRAEFEGPVIMGDDHSTITLNPAMNASIDEHENVTIDVND
ncbi:hypothetical protein [Natrialba asiatica]|uniref:N-methylhydantoinase (ATP-hydrolyzing) A 2 n=1 Tax=Natrialba asiatica (strain ATCC 700177 / DSM 12278 / JCM 9576 / FERM P-10747 / NBRC 102637 / 172P1) TaxID=29540 RepID=M0AI82_NATA1|nr:N-methylhydantoinase (ATP-hydrolyzing) A 2 [Natrialba asiatica DSM 12278]